MARGRGRRWRKVDQPSTPSSEPALLGDLTTVEVVAGLSGAVLCRVEVRDVLELKAAIEKTSGICRLDQCLTLGNDVLEDSRQLAADARGSSALVIRLVQAATVASATRRALAQISKTGDAESATEALDNELAEMPLQGVEELEDAISAVMQKAISEPHRSESCADVAQLLRTRYPRAPSQTKLMLVPTFTLSMLRMCEAELREFPEPLESEGGEMCQGRRARELAMMIFIGNAFSRGLLPVFFFGRIFRQFCQSPRPDEHHAACMCELLLRLGPTMDAEEHGRSLVTKLIRKIAILQDTIDPCTGLACYSNVLITQMRDLVARREGNWCPQQKADPAESC